MKVSLNLTTVGVALLVFGLFDCAREKHWEKLAQCRASEIEDCDKLYPGF